MRIVLAVALAFLPFIGGGCGSLSSRWNGNYGPYVGVKLDVDLVTHYQSEGEVIAAVDIPFSAIADTLFLPYDLSRSDSQKTADSAAIKPAESVGTTADTAQYTGGGSR